MRLSIILALASVCGGQQVTLTTSTGGTVISGAAAATRGMYAAVSVLSGPDACDPVLMPFSTQVHVGGHLCAPTAPASGLATFSDLNFGGISIPLTSPTTTYMHGYSLPSPISANNRYVGINDVNGGHFALDRTNGAITRIPGGSNAPIWDSLNDDWLYLMGGSKVIRHSVSANTDTVAADLAGKVTSMSNGGSTHLSGDNWTAFWSEAEHAVCAVNLSSGASYCADYLAPETKAAAIPFQFIDFSMVTNVDIGSGKRYVVLVAFPSLGIWSVNLAAGNLHFEGRGPEFPAAEGFNNGAGNQDGVCDPNEYCLGAPHGDAASFNGIQYFVTNADTAGLNGAGCGRDLVAYPLAQGNAMITKRVKIVPLGYCSSGYDWPDLWIGCSTKGNGCALTTVSKGVAPYGGQIIYVNDLEHVTKLGFHGSQPKGSDGYWWYPRAGISPDGRYIIYDSNLGRADEGNGFSHEQVFLMRTGR